MKIIEWIKRRRDVKYLNSLSADTPMPSDPVTKPTIDDCYHGVAMNDFIISQEHLREAKARADIAAAELVRMQMSMRPSKTMHINLSNDGLQWVVRLQVDSLDPRSDLVGVGDSPEKACVDFDYKWYGIEK